MDQFDLVKQFNDDLDSMLIGEPQVKSGHIQTQYNDLLNLAVVLAETELSSEKSQQQVLRRQLINRCREHYSATNKKEAIMRNFFGKHRPVLLAGSFAMVAIISFYLIFPGAFTAMAKDIKAFLKIGPYVTLINVDEEQQAPAEQSRKSRLTTEQQAELDKNGYVKWTDKDGYTVGVSTRRITEDMINYASLAEAQKAASFKLLAPKYLPDGFSFNNASRYKDDQDCITLNYQGAGKEIILMVQLMNEKNNYAIGGKLEPVVINGNKGCWVDSDLVWDKDGINYELFAKGLSKDEIMKIAESI